MNRQSGFSLIEILVSMLVLAVGLLGVASLQIQSIQHNTSAVYRTQAVQLSYGILDRIRSNPNTDYAFALTDGPPTTKNCISASCTPDEIKTYDIAEWKCSLGKYSGEAVCRNLQSNGALIDLSSLIPEGNGGITSALVGGVRTYTITIEWKDTREAGASPAGIESFQVVAAL